ncbi:MAG: hypothetical protein HGA79_10305 [Anaerolineales bacterium]|nr:hypothetical protein [Anaerolineales bacterium]NTW13027.1 hypothetical protein [Anaerolineales bacterium]
MTQDDKRLAEEYIRLGLALDEYLPGYVDSFFGPQAWQALAKKDGKLPLQNLTERTARLANDISQAEGLEVQRKDFLARQVTAMQMSLRLFAEEKIPLAEEVSALYNVQPGWVNESNFEEAHREFDQLLPPGNSLTERRQEWNRSLEIPVEKAKELVPFVVEKLQAIARRKFDLPDNETFTLEWVSDKPWAAYNWYLGDFRSTIQINADLPIRINSLTDLIAHEGYPGHHTELSIKEDRLIRQKGYDEHTIALLNSPSCVVAEGIATSALKTALPDDELEDWYREELLPRAGMSHIDSRRMMQINKASEKTNGIMGNVSFMLYDQQKGVEEAEQYLRRYTLATEQVIQHLIRFISEPLSRSYVFTYDMGYNLLEELFAHKDRGEYFKRLLEEPVTPSQIRAWIKQ